MQQCRMAKIEGLDSKTSSNDQLISIIGFQIAILLCTSKSQPAKYISS